MNREDRCQAQDRDLLQDFSDGSLDAGATSRVAAHIENCALCAAALQELQEFENAMGASHLTSSEIVDLAWGSSAEGAEHIAVCTGCRTEVEAVRNARPPEDRLDDARSGAPARWPTFVALAASVVLGVGLLLAKRSGPSQGGSRDSMTRGVDASRIGELAPQGDVTRPKGDLTFSWKGPQGVRFAVLFFSENGRLLSRVEATGTSIVANSELRAKLDLEPVFAWKVEGLAGNDSAPDSRLVRVSWRP